MDLISLSTVLKDESRIKSKPRPYFNHSVEFKKRFTKADRARVLQEVGLNVFFFPAEMVTGCDLLTDSGTTTMTNEQWASLHMGDVAYGSNRGYFEVMRQVKETFGEGFFNPIAIGRPNAFLFHQGRASEDALFTVIGKMGSNFIIPSNGHFDTTQANIEANGMIAVNLFSDELNDDKSNFHFKGNMNLTKFRELLKESSDKIPIAFITITNNTGGGQPVSMQNIREAATMAHNYEVPLFLDACRFAENAWFIKQHEGGYDKKEIKDIVTEMFSYVDGFTISFKKDGLSNMGGGLFLKDDGIFVRRYPHLPDKIMNYQITTEGHPTYGGISGRDIMSIAVGLKTVTNEDYLENRIRQVQEFGESMVKRELPVMTPVGGHAVYLDVNKFFDGTDMRPEGFGGVSLTALLLANYGHRAVELGYFSFGSCDVSTGRDIFPEFNFVRFAVPRLRYERQDLESVTEAVGSLYDEREKIPQVRVTFGRDLPLRHFKAKFAFENMA